MFDFKKEIKEHDSNLKKTISSLLDDKEDLILDVNSKNRTIARLEKELKIYKEENALEYLENIILDLRKKLEEQNVKVLKEQDNTLNLEYKVRDLQNLIDLKDKEIKYKNDALQNYMAMPALTTIVNKMNELVSNSGFSKLNNAIEKLSSFKEGIISNEITLCLNRFFNDPSTLRRF